MKSMTGFGRGECVSRGTRYSVEIGTVNRRNAELVFNLPRELASFENLLREILAPAVARGRATVTASVSSGDADRPLLDPALFRRLHRELASVQRGLKIPGAPALSDLVRLYTATARESGTAQSPPCVRSKRCGPKKERIWPASCAACSTASPRKLPP
jgi:uncharacterized protein (TIGR00255 family)